MIAVVIVTVLQKRSSNDEICPSTLTGEPGKCFRDGGEVSIYLIVVVAVVTFMSALIAGYVAGSRGSRGSRTDIKGGGERSN